MEHQLCGTQHFISEVVPELKETDDASLTELARACRTALAPLLGPTCHLILAVDEIELARKLMSGDFQRGGGAVQSGIKGLLSPLASAANL